MDFFNYVWQIIRLATVMDLLDIVIVTFVLYKIVHLIRGTTAARLLKGVALLLVVTQLADWMQLNVISFLLENTLNVGILAVVVLFQPELRKMFENVGRTRFKSLFDRETESHAVEHAIVQIVDACTSMSWSRTGALIVFERGDKLGDVVRTGTTLNAEITSELTKNIFYPKAPLHDGAVVVREGRILAAGCVLPLSANSTLSRDLGTRHRAAVGMSENTDAICVVVSEETGSISVAASGMLKRHLAPETLEKLLMNDLLPAQEENGGRGFLGNLRKGKGK